MLDIKTTMQFNAPIIGTTLLSDILKANGNAENTIKILSDAVIFLMRFSSMSDVGFFRYPTLIPINNLAVFLKKCFLCVCV